ncbi:MAG: cytochrome D1 [Gammaproteobacteria bacterium]|nr:cytochrome D1 [Gammaproteobacteria bacterium]
MLAIGMMASTVPARANDGPPMLERADLRGVSVEASIEPVAAQAKQRGGLREGDDVLVRFKVADTLSGRPRSGLFPAAWMDHIVVGIEQDAQTCQAKVEQFVAGSLYAQAEIDLNVYYVLALNKDPSISVVDPLFGFGNSKLLTLVPLESPGSDWAMTADRDRLFVAMPQTGQVAVVDTDNWRVRHNLELAGRPDRVFIQPDQKYLWVANTSPDGISAENISAKNISAKKISSVTVFDVQTLQQAARIRTGAGSHEIVFRDDNRFAFISNAASNTLSVIDIHSLSLTAQIEVGERPVSLAYSPLSQSVVVAAQGDGTVTVVDAGRHVPVASIAAKPGLVQARFAPDDRFAFIANPAANEVYIFDAVLNRIVQVAQVGSGPDQVAFSDELAFIRQRDSEIIWMAALDQIGQPEKPLSLIDFPGGQSAFSQTLGAGAAPTIVQAPGANAVLVANPQDRAIYFYKEGMAAPMGHFSNYRRIPTAVMALDRSLKEVAPGSYETLTRLRRPGQYSLAFYLDSPLRVHCFDVEVQALPRVAKASPSVRYDLAANQVPVHQPFAVRVRLVDGASGKPSADLKDVQFLAYTAPGTEQRRFMAKQVEPGLYEALFEPYTTGSYYIFVRSPSLGLRFDMASPAIVRAVAAK